MHRLLNVRDLEKNYSVESVRREEELNIRKCISALILASIIFPVHEIKIADASQIINNPRLQRMQSPQHDYSTIRSVHPQRPLPPGRIIDRRYMERERERQEQARWEAEKRERERKERERREAERREYERREAERRDRERRDWEREQAYRRELERRDWERYERERRDYERREKQRREDELVADIIGEIIKEGLKEEAARERRRTRY